MHSPARGRFLCILTCLMMLVPALPEGPVGAGSTHTQGGQDFQNGISNRVSATEEGLELAVETEMPYNWTRLNMGEPGTKNFPHMEYDLKRKVSVLMGWDVENECPCEVWTYNSTTDTWKNMRPLEGWGNYQSPGIGNDGSIALYSMAYDRLKDALVTFGVEAGGAAHTWIYDLAKNKWTMKDPSFSPAARVGHSLVYDDYDNEIILFGGTNYLNYDTFYNETWSYNTSTNTWTNRTPAISPPARANHSMAFDKANGEMVLFGGYSGAALNDTWTYNLSKNLWTRKNPTNAPSPRYMHDMIYHDGQAVTILYGGFDTSELKETWSYNLSADAWTELKPASKPHFSGPVQMVYEPGTGQIVTFLGSGYLVNLALAIGRTDEYIWKYDLTNNTWTPRPPKAPTPRSADGCGLHLAYDTSNRKFVLYSNDIGLPYDTWTYDLSTNIWKKMDIGSGPTYWCYNIVYDSVNGVFIALGQSDPDSTATWAYNLSTNTWTPMDPLVQPNMNYATALTYDSKRGEVFFISGGTINETWIYNYSNNTWTQLLPVVSPPTRYYAKTVYIEVKDEIMLFVGRNIWGDNLAETWMFNRTQNTWYNVTGPKTPEVYESFEMVYDSSRNEAILVKGYVYYGNRFNETWRFNITSNGWDRIHTRYYCPYVAGYSLGYDRQLKEIIRFGGSESNDGTSGEVWVFHGHSHYQAGNYTSEPQDAGGPASFGELDWESDVPEGTGLRFQVRTNDTNASVLTGNFLGPDGTDKTYYDTSGQKISNGSNGSRWFQYRVYFCTTNTAVTPVLKNVTVRFNLLPEMAVLDTPEDGMWTNNSRPLFAWNFSDQDSTVGGFQWQLDNSSLFDFVDIDSGTVTSTGSTYQPNTSIPDGTWSWRVRTLDSDGDWGPFSAGRLLHIDTAPPEPFQPAASPSGWTNGTIQVSYETTDAFSGMGHYELSIDGASPGPQGSPFTLSLLSDGEHNITIKAFDKVWNNISAQVKVYQDRTPPLEFTPTAEPPSWTNSSPQILFGTTDATSGVERYEVAIDSGSFSCQTSPYLLPELSDGQHDITVRAYDKAGNSIDGWVIVYIDTYRPFNFSVVPEFTAWTNKNPNITFQALDNTSEIDHFEVKVPGGNFTVRTSPFKLPDLPDGRHTILLRVYDKASNFVEMSIEVLIDKTAPAGFTPTADPPNWTKQNPKIIFSTTDNTSGISRYEVGIDDGAMAVSTSPFTVSNLTDGTHTVVIRAYDMAGNFADGTVRVYIDKTSPTQLVLKINDGDKSTGKRTVTLDMLASDASSGLDSMAFSNDGVFYSDWEPFNASKVWDLSKATGTKVVYFKVRDKAGNEALPVTSSIKYAIPVTVGQDNSLLLYLLIGLTIIVAVVVSAWRISKKPRTETDEGALTEEKIGEEPPEAPAEEGAPPEALPVAAPVAEKPEIKAAPEAVPVPSKVEKAPSAPEVSSPKVAASPAAPSPRAPAPPAVAATKVAAAPEGFAVEDIFLMYRDGRLIHHSTRRLKADMDVDVVTSMLTAVQEFIKESFGKAEGQELGSLEFGDSKIMLQKGKYIILAAVISGPEAPGFRDELRSAVKNIEGEFGAVLPTWDGTISSLAGAKKFLTSLGTSQPVAAVPAKTKEEVSLKAELEFYQGFVRLKVAVKNSMPTFIMGAVFKPIFSEKALKLYSIEPDYEVKGDEILLGNVEPNEKKAVALYLDPQICTESYLEGVLTYKDAHGNLATLMLPRKLAAVVCPILFTDENINTAMLKRMAADELDKKDTKVFSIPANLTPQKAFEIAKGAAQHHDLRQVREYSEKDPFIGEVWYYGKAKGRNERLVVRARVIAEKNVLEFYVASDSVLMLTGMLAELKTDLRKEMETQKLRGGMSQVTDQNLVDTLASIRTLMDKAAASDPSGSGLGAR